MLVKGGLGLIFMRNILIVIFILLVGLILLGYNLFSNQDVIEDSVVGNTVKDVNNLIISKAPDVSQSKASLIKDNSENKSIKIDGFMDEKRFNEILKEGEKNGVTYKSLTTLEPRDKVDVEKAIENLTKTGSISGGIKLNEFSELDKARDILNKEGLHNMLAKLSGFKSVPDSIFKKYNMKVTGAQNFGSYHQDTGWSGIYKLYENSNQKVEIEQIYLKPNESSQMIISESLNTLLSNETPAIYEHIKNESIEKLTFVSDRNYYQINSSNLSKDQIFDIANEIIVNPNK